MKVNRTSMTNQEPQKRTQNFDEVALGFSLEEAINEALRCIDCKNPRCVQACPVQVDIPGFIKHIINKDFDQAYQTIYQNNILPAICGRVCPQENQCEGACILSIKGESVSIGALERYIGDYGLGKNKHNPIIENNVKVAIVGSGPSGLSAAAELRKMGYHVDVFEALHDFGGVLMYGIPDFRLPKDIVKTEIEQLQKMGIHFHKNVIVGKSITIDQLLNEEGYSAIYIASGAGLPKALNVPGENLTGVIYANEFLTRVNLMKAHKKESSTPVKIGNRVAVVGGGNVAMDAARTAKRLGSDVFILYRRDMDSLPARLEEIHHAQEEGILFKLLRNPVEFIGENYQLKKVKCEIMELGEPDQSGRRRPLPTNQFEWIDVDNVIVSIGQNPNPILKEETPSLHTDQWGRVTVTNHQTSIEGVFAGGDIVSGAATVILAMGAGKEAAVEINNYIQSRKR